MDSDRRKDTLVQLPVCERLGKCKPRMPLMGVINAEGCRRHDNADDCSPCTSAVARRKAKISAQATECYG